GRLDRVLRRACHSIAHTPRGWHQTSSDSTRWSPADLLCAGEYDRRYRRVASVSCSSAEGEHTAVVDQGLRVPASLARVKYGMGVVWQIWAVADTYRTQSSLTWPLRHRS